MLTCNGVTEQVMYWSSSTNDERERNQAEGAVQGPSHCETCLSKKHYVTFDMWLFAMQQFNIRKANRLVFF